MFFVFSQNRAWELMGHASIVTTMRYIHATDQGKRGAIVSGQSIDKSNVTSLTQQKNGRLFNLP
jgi:hypothetical protein